MIDRSATEWTFPSWMEISTIGLSAFEGFRNLANIIIPDGVTTIGNCAFYGCNSLTSISMPDSVTRIDGDAFTACGLTNVTIPSSVTSIGSSVFHYCHYLTDIYMYPTTPPTLGNTNAIPTTTTIHVPIGSGDSYKTATNWSSFADKIVEDIEI